MRLLKSYNSVLYQFLYSVCVRQIIPPGGNTSFDVVFLARVVGNVENTLFINTSHHGVFTYQVRTKISNTSFSKTNNFSGRRNVTLFYFLKGFWGGHPEPLQAAALHRGSSASKQQLLASYKHPQPVQRTTAGTLMVKLGHVWFVFVC